ncbi:MAG: LytTR family DNA-binding domain-containing protein [Defluviitaleaceae bacterium]|nr:LytTR family DNA-binding domain-containing protein [Defluviitaleaceae bacterium]
MNIAICDDTLADANKAKEYVGEYYNHHCNIDVFLSEVEFLEKFTDGYYDVIFMDIYLVQGNGIAVSKIIRQTDKNCLIVFVTTSADHAIEAFGVDAAHYIRKPISREEVAAVLEKCGKLLSKKGCFIPIKSNRDIKKVYLAELLYTEVYHNTCRIVTLNGEIKIRQTMSEIERLIRDTESGAHFVRCHQSYLVNLDFVKEVTDNCFVMENRDIVIIRRSDRTAIKAAFEDYLFAKM